MESPLERWRHERAMSRADLAVLAGVSPSGVQQAERLGVLPRKLATALEQLGVDVEGLAAAQAAYRDSRRLRLQQRIVSQRQGTGRRAE